MPKISLKKNYLFSLAYEFFNLLAPLITTPYISRVLGAEKIGEFSFTYSIAAYFAYFAALGTTLYARRGVAYLQENREQRTLLFWEIILLRLFLTVICLLSYVALLLHTGLSMVALAQGLYIFAVAFDIVWLFQGMENFTWIVIRNLIIKILGIAFIFIFVKSKDDLVVYVLGNGLLPLIGSFIFWFSVRRYIGKIPAIKKLHPFHHLRGSFALFVPTIASQAYLLLDKTMIGIFAENGIENGFYEQSQKIVRICWTIVTTFAVIMAPRIASFFAQKNIEKVRVYMKKSFRFVWLISLPIAFGLAGVTKNMIPWFFGDEFLPVKELIYIFAFIIVPVGISAVSGSQYLVTIKKQNVFTLSIVCGAVLNFGMNCFLIPSFFAKGAAISSVCAEYVVAFVQICYITVISKDFSFKDVFSGFAKYCMIGLAMFVFVFQLGNVMSPSILHTFVLIVLGFFIYTFSLLLVKDDYAMMIVEKCKSYIGLRKKDE